MVRRQTRGTLRSLVYLMAGAAALSAAMALPSTAQAAPPPNDDFPGTTITSLPFTDTVDTTGGTDEPGETFCGPIQEGVTVWYNYTPATDTTLLADMGGTDFIGFVSARTGTSLSDLTCAASGGTNLDPVSHSAAVFRASGGTTYYFQAGSNSFPPFTGSLTFSLKEGVAPPNDDFPGTEITSLPFNDSVDTTFATLTPSEGGEFGPLVWYNYTAAQDVTLVADTSGSDYPTIIGLRSGMTLRDSFQGRHTYLGCEFADRVEFDLTAGQTVYIPVGTAFIPPTRMGTLLFSLSEAPPGGASALDCPEPTLTPGPTIIADGLPRAGASPPATGGWPSLVLLGGVLLAAAAATLALAARRSQK